ncbi:MAG: TetR/AcrR family transcriptional regulator [Spirochaetales bacterium]|nr:TetR/AcrR family transcriptional regulator [Spirochaetales bacterium]
MHSRRRGRPRKSERVLSRDEILTRAAQLVLGGGSEVGMRRIARALKVDPMALYHYFPDKGALYEGLVIRLIDGIYRPTEMGEWREELETLTFSYLELLVCYRGLLGAVLRLGARAEGPAEVFRRRFETASRTLRLNPADCSIAIGAAVDFVHGFVAAFEYAEEGTIAVEDARGSIRVIIDGVAMLSRRAVHSDEARTEDGAAP